ncbi:hypothetical protein [Microvirga thermotolerans]|uniref:Uncharacterized protein n=1 Tax=Microvirga thermotolerans TaxID=2651334 RepID=A0A5P9JYQ8_9HYPH|nr:hypothetical protein [Microvirga thermotolerans]QFU16878.1 hypothetical protein GDR74_11935 [Microvirga thermotolerans]
MRKTLIGLTSALTLAASAAAVPTPASAYPGWVIPAIAAAGVGGIALGAGITSAQAQTTGTIVSAAPGTPVQPQIGYDPNTMVQPGCHLARERIRGEWRRVEVCP